MYKYIDPPFGCQISAQKGQWLWWFFGAQISDPAGGSDQQFPWHSPGSAIFNKFPDILYLDLLGHDARKNEKYSPNGGLMVVYHGRK